MQKFTDSIIMAGCGNMGSAMLQRWLDTGLDPAHVTVVRPSGGSVARGVAVQRDVDELSASDILILAFKPQQLAELAPIYVGLAGPDTIVLSILAGIEAHALRSHFPHASSIIRAMPNLPVAIGQGVVLLAGEAAMPAHAAQQAEALLAPLGILHWVSGDQDFNTLTALTGCSPAFLYAFTESLADAAIQMGVGEEDALRLAQSVVHGSAAFAASNPDVTPADRIAAVASKGGMTQAGIDALRDGKALTILLHETLSAARDRGAELSKG